MPGYILISQNELAPTKTKGMTRFVESIGMLDFLRELENDEIPFSRNACVRVEGLEEVLFAVRPDYGEMAARIRNRLNAAANELHNKLVTVQVVFKGRLERGVTLRSQYRDEKLPVGLIFGSPTSVEVEGSTAYRVPFSLTTP